MPATAKKAMAWMNHFGESGLSSIYRLMSSIFNWIPALIKIR
jgi:hypothetical protein